MGTFTTILKTSKNQNNPGFILTKNVGFVVVLIVANETIPII